jgi:3-mercaptopyruvate sulfurtransferase SseA
MKTALATLILFLFAVFSPVSFAQQQRKYPVDPQTRWAVGAQQKPADDLKSQLDAGKDVLIIDVRNARSFERETIPGAINIPLEELEEHLKSIPKDKLLVFI